MTEKAFISFWAYVAGNILFYAWCFYFFFTHWYDLNVLYRGQNLILQETIFVTIHTGCCIALVYSTSTHIHIIMSFVFLISHFAFFVSYFLLIYRIYILHKLEFGKFHGECLICEECGKAVLNNFAYKNGFFHSQCLTQLKKAGNTEKIKQKNDEESKRAYQGEKTRQDEKNMSIEKQKNIEEEKKSMVSGNVDGINNDKIKKIEDKTEEKKAEELRPAETNITNIQETSKIAPTKVSGIKEEAKNTNKIKSSQIAAKVGEASNEKNKKSQVAKVENAAKKNQDCVIRKKNQNNPGALPAKKK